MKLKNINLVMVVALGMLTVFTGCTKDDGAIPKNIGIEDVPVISMNLEAGGIVDTIRLASQTPYRSAFKVTLFFAGATPPTKIDIMVRKSASNIKLFKADITTLPANFTITAAEIATLFGAPLLTKENYDFGPDIYIGAKKYEAFPAVGVGSGQGITGMSAIGFGEYVRYAVK